MRVHPLSRTRPSAAKTLAAFVGIDEDDIEAIVVKLIPHRRQTLGCNQAVDETVFVVKRLDGCLAITQLLRSPDSNDVVAHIFRVKFHVPLRERLICEVQDLASVHTAIGGPHRLNIVALRSLPILIISPSPRSSLLSFIGNKSSQSRSCRLQVVKATS